MRISLDANVLFAAAQSPAGRSALLLTFAKEGHCTCISSPHAVTEAERNLRVRYPLALEQFQGILSTVHLVQEATSQSVHWALQQGLPR